MLTKRVNKIIVVGSVAGGASAAARLRRISEEAQIIIIEKGLTPSFANCGMPYFLGGQIESRSSLIVTGVDTLRNRYILDVRTQTEVLSIERDFKTVTCRKNGIEYSESYEKLILCTGAKPFVPKIDGINNPKVFFLRDLEDMDKIKENMKLKLIGSKCLIIGGGFIGCEVAEAITHSGVHVTILERMNQIMPPMDKEMTIPVQNDFKKHGVDILFEEECVKFSNGGLENNQVVAHFKTGANLTFDFIIIAVGVTPDNKLAIDSGLKIGVRGGIIVNEHCQTSDSDIYACGDNSEIEDFILKSRTQIPLAGIANRQGRIAANHIFSRKPDSFRGAQGTSIMKCFEQTIASTGASEKLLIRSGYKSFDKVYIPANDHAGYYPGANRMIIKLIFDTSEDDNKGKILGCQIVGQHEGIANRINAFAMAIQGNMSVFDLEESELAYSPQYGSAKDAVNMAGFVSSGVLRHEQIQIHASDLRGNRDSFTVVDVRSQSEYDSGHIDGAIHVPIENLRGKCEEMFDKNSNIVVYCKVGFRGYMASLIMREHGFSKCVNLSGGFECFSSLY